MAEAEPVERVAPFHSYVPAMIADHMASMRQMEQQRDRLLVHSVNMLGGRFARTNMALEQTWRFSLTEVVCTKLLQAALLCNCNCFFF